MKVVFLLTALLTSSSAFAASYKILGRGIENKETGERLVLGCVDKVMRVDDCLSIQHIYFKDQHSDPEWVGIIYHTSIRKIQKDYRNSRRDRIEDKIKHSPWTGVGAAGIAVLIITAPPNGFYVWPIMLAFGFATYWGPNMFVSKNAQVLEVTFQDSAGWNWSERPKRIGEKRFKNYFDWIKVEVER